MKTNSKKDYQYPSQSLTKDNSNKAVVITMFVIISLAMLAESVLNH